MGPLAREAGGAADDGAMALKSDRLRIVVCAPTIFAGGQLLAGGGRVLGEAGGGGELGVTQALKLAGEEKVLEIGTGSGYQAAVLAELGAEVYSMEILPELSRKAGAILSDLSYSHVQLLVGDGFEGWAEHAPYDGILVTAAPGVPPPLVAQLKENGRLVVPIGPEGDQVLYTYQKETGRARRLDRLNVRFVQMTGKALR